MGNAIVEAAKAADHDFIWSYTDEPHATRRKELLKKYPQIKDLYGYEWTSKYVVLWWVLSQFFISIFVAPNLSWSMLTLVAYAYGGIAAHALFLGMHETSHSLLFASVSANRAFGVFSNLATAFPHFSMFQKYHLEHHKYQGVENIDVDVPTRYEAVFFQNMLAKLLWIFFQPLFYIFRPLLIKPKSPGFWEFVNFSACIACDLLVYCVFGTQAIVYLMLSSFFGAGLHPVSGHFIAEHYVFILQHETYSYYGPLNFLSVWVGFHNEHHDFPRIPGCRLHKLREIAPEYYDNLPCHTSWVKVLWDYVVDPRVGPWSRTMRKGKEDENVGID